MPAPHSPLPVGIVVPTLNAMPHLAGHVRRLRELAPRVEEIVVVDSHSTDGTAEYLREHLALPKARHLTHPPGLYASWNFGLAQLRAPFAYLATVGDAVPAATLGSMVALAEAHQADVLLTPPRLVLESGEISPRRWPIHDYIEQHRLTAPAEIPGWKAFAWTALNVPAGLLGSSASNLYRTTVMQRHPFPMDYGYHGDTAWLLENALRLRLVIAPNLITEFLVHEAAGRRRSGGDQPRRARLSQLARETWQAARDTTPSPNGPPGCERVLQKFWEQMDQWLALRQRLQERRAAGAWWWLDSRAWRLRSELRRAMNTLKQTAREGMKELECASATEGWPP